MSAIDVRLAAVTVTVTVDEAEPQTLATAQVPRIVAVPVPTALIFPLLLTVATDGSEEDQVRSMLTSAGPLSLDKTVALSCVEVPFAILGLVSSISIEFTPWALFSVVVPPPPQAARRIANNAKCEHRTKEVVMQKGPIFMAIGRSEAVIDGDADDRIERQGRQIVLQPAALGVEVAVKGVTLRSGERRHPDEIDARFTLIQHP